MGFIDGLLGNASTLPTAAVKEELAHILLEGEKVEAAFKLVRDLIVFTDKRLILVNKQGITGKKTEFQSIPYKSISRFSVETAGRFDLDSELKIWISGAELPAVSKQFKKDESIYDIQKVLAAVCM
ncbi:PH domain-containing protein [Bacillus subtilis]|uniref:PH domain-containing protein n=1 Tax=Bacillus subtilis TaxID=1423 RepID=UPI000F530B6A|nr:PH domain-containing protein [Bacillus subtilis]MBU8676647.1 PH domain-containing protein [Bacillus subtilis]MDF4198297.1 PH domain-containing protein [Bacillus subtilis]MDF4216026.1 PH domain-containing protein [Bacillus subtilis]MEC2402886.1 PH domain-containing protein [Bacillus subtilis]MED1810440.1 PH domain-containing protein [Bacillus subtilis]